MQEDRNNSHATTTRIFIGEEDDVADGLLSILRRDKWENFELHYERGTFSAERTDLHIREDDGETEEVPLTFALCATWFASDEEVELMIEVDEPDFDWTQSMCAEIGAKIIQELSTQKPTVNDGDNGHGGLPRTAATDRQREQDESNYPES